MRRKYLPSMTALAGFRAAARHGSFTRAAEELSISQSAISHQVNQIEKQLGIRLFERIGNRIVLTEKGSVLYEGLRAPFEQVDVILRELVTANPTEKTLRISCPATFATNWLTPRMLSFAKLHPELRLDISTFTASAPSFDEDIFDVAILHGKPQWRGILSDRLMDETMLPMCSPDLMKSAKLHRPENLRSVMLLHHMVRPAWADWLVLAGVTDVDLSRGARFDHYSALIAATLGGLGVALLPDFLVEAHISAGRLVIPFKIPMQSGLHYYLAYPEAKRQLDKVKTFRRWLLSNVEK